LLFGNPDGAKLNSEGFGTIFISPKDKMKPGRFPDGLPRELVGFNKFFI